MKRRSHAKAVDANQPGIVEVGSVWGRWTVLLRGESLHGRRSMWLCRCSCGRERLVLGQNLRNGSSVSCGCLRDEVAAEMCRCRTAHGNAKRGEKTRVYRIWRHMLERCNSPACKGYKYYGGKGVKVCEEWEEFIQFSEWSVENGYTDSLSIDRVDSGGDYEPGNCRWITRSENARRANLERWAKKRAEVHT